MPLEDELARMRAQGDQSKEAAKEVAGVLWAFFHSLTEEGFNEMQALHLVGVYITALFGGGDDE